MVPGGVVEISVGSIGTLANPIVDDILSSGSWKRPPLDWEQIDGLQRVQDLPSWKRADETRRAVRNLSASSSTQNNLRQNYRMPERSNETA
jgi:hypothetical protein